MGRTAALLAILGAASCAWLTVKSAGSRRLISRSRSSVLRHGTRMSTALNLFHRLSGFSKRDETLAQNCLLLEIVVLGLDAGLSIESCLRLGTRYGKGEAAVVIKSLLAELQLGESRARALRRASAEVGEGEIRVVLRSLYKAQKAGAGVKRAARIALAQATRDGQTAAREALLKAPIKMLFPLVGLILPSLMLVLLAPAVLRMLGGG